MPGILGAYNTELKDDLSALMNKMIISMSRNRKMKTDRFMEDDGRLCMGRVSLGILNPIDQPVKNPEGNCSIVFHGELYGNNGSLSDPAYVLNQYVQKGDECVLALNGIFHFAIYDRRSGQIKLFSDKFGLQPLYYSVFHDGIVFGGEVKALLADDRVIKKPDYEGFADFFHYGQILGHKTLFRDVKLLAPGSVLTLNLSECTTSLKEYWNLKELFVEHGNYNSEALPEEVASLLIQSIEAQSTQQNTLGLSLSGGLDSRALLAGLKKHSEDIHTYTLGLPGCADQKLAERMARVGKTNHEFLELKEAYLEDFHSMASDMIIFSDGMYHPYESTEMLALEYFKRAPFRILLRGHGGEIAKAALAYPVMVTPQAHSCSPGQEILEYIYVVTNLVMRDIDQTELFNPWFSEFIFKAPKQSLKDSFNGMHEVLAPADACIYYYINEHIRRQVVASLDIFRTQIEIRMPYIEEQYLRHLLELPVSERNEGEIHFRLIKRCMPDLIRIPNSNTGAPLDAGPLRLFITDKFNSLMRRIGIKGFRHYTEFQKWHRQSFKESSKKIIFSDLTENREIYNMEHLKSIFELHISGRKDYGHLLGTIVGLELWFRSFVD